MPVGSTRSIAIKIASANANASEVSSEALRNSLRTTDAIRQVGCPVTIAFLGRRACEPDGSGGMDGPDVGQMMRRLRTVRRSVLLQI